MTTPPQDTPPDLPDRVYEIVGTDSSGNPMYRPTHPFMALDGTERFETFRTWFVGEDGKTSIERERDALREKLEAVPDRIRELSQFVDPKHHEKFHQLAEVIVVFTKPTQQEPDDE